jgi:putative ABC transport system permease protein
MILREIERKPLRPALSSDGIAMAVAILVVGRFQMDAIEHLMRVQFHEAWAEDVAVSFLAPLDGRAVRDIEHMPGVLHAEGSRVVPVRFRSGPRFRDSVVIGYQDGGALRRPLDGSGREVELPPDGMVVSRKLAELLGVRPGETMTVEVREGKRETKHLLVVSTIDDMFGLFAYMRLSALQRWLGEEPSVSQVVMSVDSRRLPDIQNRLKEIPAVQSVLRKQTIIDQFREQSAEWMVTMTLIMTLFASVIAVGVVYNNARVALSLRARDLGSLRVLGFTRAEVSFILLGELAVQMILAIPIGLFVGRWMAHAIMETVDPEQYRMPVIISLKTYAFAAAVALASGVASALLVRRKLDSLDLIAVLKSHE